MLARNIRGASGRATLPGIGALIGETYAWQLYSEDKVTYTLRAQFNQTFHEELWEKAGDSRRIELEITKGHWHEAKPVPGTQINRNGRHLMIKGVNLVPLDR